MTEVTYLIIFLIIGAVDCEARRSWFSVNTIKFVTVRKDARVVEWDGLENRYTGNCIEGSNPSLSASTTATDGPREAGAFCFNADRAKLALQMEAVKQKGASRPLLLCLTLPPQGSPKAIPLFPPSVAEATFGGRNPQKSRRRPSVAALLHSFGEARL